VARLNKETWERLKADYVTGAYTLELLAKKYGVSKAAISKKIKKENWGKVDLKETAELVEMEKVNKSKQKKVNKIAKLTNVSPDKFEEAISEITDLKSYFQDLTLLAAEKVKETLQDGKVEEIATVSGEMGEIRVVERRLNPREIKSLVDAIDKAGQTLGVVPRFSQQVNIQNNQVVENKTLEIRFVDGTEDK
jgi:predicted DNA-binding protein YlxM (UPF0122 family)